MRTLSKSKLLAYRQCPKRLWLEIHRKELRKDSAFTQASFSIGHQVGEIARQLYDPGGKGQLIDLQVDGFDAAIARSAELLNSSQPIFEAGFSADGAVAFADVMLPVGRGTKRVWKMIEVKSSTAVKNYHFDDTAVQSYIARSAGVPLRSIALAHIDRTWVYPGSECYQGLLVEKDLTAKAFGRGSEVEGWIVAARKVAGKRNEPAMGTGQHCKDPYECGFLEYCRSREPRAEYPVSWLPSIQTKALKQLIAEANVRDIRDIPDDLLNERQRRVKTHTLSGEIFFDAQSAAKDLAPYKLPAYFLDFETAQFAVPIWKGTRPYQKIPFQFSLHRLSRTGRLDRHSFIDLSGQDPSKAFAEALVAVCGERGPVFAYGADFEKGCIKELATLFPKLRKSFLAINERLVDLLRVAEQHYYHPIQQGSWSIKKVLPAIAPDLRYDALDGIQNGGMAMEAFHEAISSTTSKSRKAQIEQQLFDYCGLDTYAMVRIWQYLAGRNDLSV